MKNVYFKILTLLFLGLVISFNSCKSHTVEIDDNDHDELNTWVNVTNGWPKSCNYITRIGNLVYLFADYKLFSSSNNGDSWNSIGLGIPDSTWINEMEGIDNYLAVATDGRGVFISNDFGNTWIEPANNGLDSKSKYVHSIEMDDEFIYIGAGLDAVVFRSSDLGNNWESFNEGFPPRIPLYIPRIIILEKFNDLLFTSLFAEGIYYSENDGVSWQSLNEGITLSSHPWIFSLAISDSFYLANITEDGIYHRTFYGTSWTKVLDNTADYNPHFVVAQGCTVLASRYSGMVISFDNGRNWKSCNKGLENISDPYFYYATIHNDYVFAVEHYGDVYRYSLK